MDEQRLIDQLTLGEIIYTLTMAQHLTKPPLAGQWQHQTEQDWPPVLVLHGASNQVLIEQRAMECCLL